MTLVKYILKKFVPLFVGSLCFFAFVLVLVDLFMNLWNFIANVLSTTNGTLCSCAIFAYFSTSTTSEFGFPSVSMNNAFVFS